MESAEDVIASESSSSDEVTAEVGDARESTTSTSANDQVNDEPSTQGEPLPAADEKKPNGSDDSDDVSSVTASATRDQEIERARKNFEDGKKLIFFQNDYEKGAEVLKFVCNEYCNVYGPLGEECGEVLMIYGLALLLLRRERARMRLFDDGEFEDGCAEIKMSHECVEEGRMQTDYVEESAEEFEGEEKGREAAEMATDQPEKEATEDEIECIHSSKKEFLSRPLDLNSNASSGENNGKASEVQSEDGENGQESKDSEEGEESDEEERIRAMDDYNLVHAIFEVFKIAAKIFTASKDFKHLAYVISKVGEVAVDLCDFKAAVNNFKTSLQILENVFEDGHHFQKIALRYQLFLAYFKDFHFGEAEVELIEALTLASEYLPRLREKLDNVYRTNHDRVQMLTEEITEIEELIKLMMKQAADFPAQRLAIQKYNKRLQKLVTDDHLSELFSVMSLLNESTDLRGDRRPELCEMPTHIVWPKPNPFEEKHELIYSLIEKIDNIIEKPLNEDELLRRSKRKIDSDNGGSDQLVLRVKIQCLD